MTSSRQPVRAVLVNYRCADHIEARLRSGVLDGPDEVLIVDNASDPERVAGWKSEFGITPLLLPQNVGFAAAVNEAVRRSRTSSPVLLLNPDAELDRESLAALLRALDTGYDGVAPVLLDADGGVQVGAAGGPLTLRSIVTYFLFLAHVFPSLRGVFLTRRQLARGAMTDWLCMACLLVRSDAFQRFGPIPEDEIVYAEDLAWGTTASRRGARFAVLPEVRVVHAQGVSGGAAAWTGAFERLVRRRLGPVAGRLGVAAAWTGLAARRLLKSRR